ncbi:urea ABC transporter permease subunit UrtC [Pseudolactococcus chungangensis]|uniref:urea ABC transporter permease subunit UrtC n=1 Tax=Pseudolactococcus chungangensis TaxID=451457 RepID=UPI003FA1FE28
MTLEKIKQFVSHQGRLLLISAVFLILALLPFYSSMFRVTLFAKFMTFAIVALGLDMIWGYTGILSLGHGVYFGLGGYCMAMYLKLAATPNSLPDFMVWTGIKKLPAIWFPFQYPIFALSMVVLAPIVLAVIIGTLTFLNGIKGVYFSILSQALSMIMVTLLIGSQAITGGSNGLTNFISFMGMDLKNPMIKIRLFYVTLLILILIFSLCYFVTKRNAGKLLIAIKGGENRVRFIGYNAAKYKIFVYSLSAAIAGIAGALYVLQVGIISPTEVGIAFSIEMIIWVAIGGKGTLVGAVIGALLVNNFKTTISETYPTIWPYFIGGIFVLVMLFLPNGLMSLKDIPTQIRQFIVKRRLSKMIHLKQEELSND